MEKENDTLKAGLAGQEPAPPVSEELAKIIEESAIEGLNGAILVFLQRRRYPLDDDRALKFAELITSEFGEGETVKRYPLTKSIKFYVNSALVDGTQTFSALHLNGEENNLRKLIRVIVSGEMLTVMQEKLEEVMKAYNEL